MRIGYITPTMKAAIYLRVSTEEQANSGLGLEAQLAACQAVAAKYDVGSFEVFTDAGVSGSTPVAKRLGLTAALAYLRKGDVLIVAKRDRLSRTMAISIELEELLKSRRATLVSANGEGSGSESEDVGSLMQRRMFQVFAEIERGMIRDRTRAALQAKKARGERVGSIPYGYQLTSDGTRLEVSQREQEVIALVRRLQAEGLSQRAIVARLNTEGAQTRTGNSWSKTQIARILAN